MGELPGLVVTGASGRMGQTLIRLVEGSDKLRLVACVERTGHPWIGRDVGEDHRCSLGHESSGDGAADSRGGSGDEGDFVIETRHGQTLITNHQL